MAELVTIFLQVVFGLLVVGLLCWSLAHPSSRHDLRPYQAHADWLEAKARAEKLLAELLREEDYLQLGRRGYIEVASPNCPGRVYRVPKYRGRVHVYEHGKPVMSLCVQPMELVPDADVVVMHKLMIEGNEQEYLRIANRFDVIPYRAHA
ncbi:MAG: hypothetical protein M3281_02935 [Chloroflexota bacterium]|nr:hypothetical protein [Chloroflexota bacterium]